MYCKLLEASSPARSQQILSPEPPTCSNAPSYSSTALDFMGGGKRVVTQTNPSSTPSNFVTHNRPDPSEHQTPDIAIHVPSVNHLAVKQRQTIHPSRNLPSRNPPSRNMLPPNKHPGAPHPLSILHPPSAPSTLYRHTDPTRLDSPLTSHVADRRHPPPSRTEREEVRPSVSTVPSRVGLGTPRVRDHASLRPRSQIGRPH